ncbi:MAG: hypothetical protein ACRDZV_12120 [Acidimicrobiia bacterium]
MSQLRVDIARVPMAGVRQRGGILPPAPKLPTVPSSFLGGSPCFNTAGAPADLEFMVMFID